MSTEVQSVVKVENALDATRREKRSVQIATTLNSKKQPKPEDGKLKFRKRSQSFSGSKLFPPYKKRKKDNIALPTKFLLGGNIRDPLNLNSFQDEEVNRAMNAITPESSPLPTPNRKGEIEVIIPADIRDPLSLAGGAEDNIAYAASFITTSTKRVKKNKKKKKSKTSAGSGKEDNSDIKSDESKGEEAIEVDIKKETNEKPLPVEETIEETKQEIKPAEETTVVAIKREHPVKPTTLECGGITAAKRPCSLVERSTSSASGQIVVQLGPNTTATNTVSGGGMAGTNQIVSSLSAAAAKVTRKFDNKDKIVSPVVPQPGAWLDRHHHARFRKQSFPGTAASSVSVTTGTNVQAPKFKEVNKKFQFGNYHRYYGYRNISEEDARLKLLCQRLGLSFFQDKDVLDIGCNSGLLTIAVGKDLGAKHVIGMDIDKTLIQKAKSSLKRYSQSMVAGSGKFKKGQIFPLSMPVVYGSLNVPGVKDSSFPRNVTFIQGNYVLENDILLDMEQPQFDIILCLSVTKWIHLNWGDEGLKRAFKRMFAQLRPGGSLILEPQSWTSYKRKKNLTETTWKNYKNIKLYPPNFTEYLLSEVGFNKCEVIGSPYNPSKGFQRPIKQFTKGRTGNETPNMTNRTPVASSEQQSKKIDEVEKSSSLNSELLAKVEKIEQSMEKMDTLMTR